MKKLLLLLLLIPFFGNAQTDTTNFEWTFINNVTGTKQELYSRARNWAVDVLKNSKYALQIDNVDLGELRFQASFTGDKTYQTIGCDVQVDVKDRKYRFHSFNYHLIDIDGSSGFPLNLSVSPIRKAFSKKPNQLWWLEVKDDAINETKVLYELLVKTMSQKQSDNW